VSVLFALAVAALPAAEKLDLKRVTPVSGTEQIPVMDFFRPRVLQEPELNPSGTHIAAIVSVGEDRHQLLVYELKTQQGEMIGAPGDTDVYRVDWLNDSRLLFHIAFEKQYGLGLFAANVGSINMAYPVFQYFGSELISVPTQNRLRPLVWNHRFERAQGVVVADTDLHTGRFRNLYKVSATASDWDEARSDSAKHVDESYPAPEAEMVIRYLADKAGQLEFAFTAQKGISTLLRLVAGKWVKCPVDLDLVEVIACGEAVGQLVVRGPRQEGKPRALQFMDSTSGQLGAVLLQDDAYDFFGGGDTSGSLYRDPVSHNIIGAKFERNGPQMAWFDASYQQLQKNLESLSPGLVVRLIGGNEAKTLFLVAIYSDRQPAIYKWVDLESHKVGLIKNSAPWIDPQRMQPMSILSFKTRDGHELDAYLTLPAGATKGNPPPLVVLAHGGPWARDTWGFDGEVQFLVSRGYAVLQPNYRGSNGYGWRFPEEDEWNFRKMHDDVTDATKAITASGLIDRDRIAIMGGSFGGYLAVSGVVNEPSLYRCAVSIAGVFDWAELIKSKKYDRHDSPVYDRLMRNLGDPKKQQEKFEAISPVRHVEQIRVPVFVAGGKYDQVVEIQQSKRLISELEKAHVPYEKLLVGDEGHGMSHLKNQVELYTRIAAFLEKNLKQASPMAKTP
jgi:acetyl esterase/lipase